LFIALAILVTGCESAQEAVDKETPAAKQRFALYRTAVRAALAKPVATRRSCPRSSCSVAARARSTPR